MEAGKGGSITIEEAYDELTHQAFSVWIRLMLAKPYQLTGRAKTARMLNHSVSQFNAILRELKFKGYIKVTPQGRGRKTKLDIVLRPILSGPTGFITLSNFAFPPPSGVTRLGEVLGGGELKKLKKTCENPDKNPAVCFQCRSRDKYAQKSKLSCDGARYFSAPLKPRKKQPILRNFSNHSESDENSENEPEENPTRSENGAKPTSLIGRKTTHGMAGRKVPRARVKMEPAQFEEGSRDASRDTGDSPGKSGGTISLDKFKNIRNKNTIHRAVFLSP